MESVYEEMYDKLKREFEQYKLESVKWSVEDFTTAEYDTWSITEEQAHDALESMIHNHDCEYGITWQSVFYYITIFGNRVEPGKELWRTTNAWNNKEKEEDNVSES